MKKLIIAFTILLFMLSTAVYARSITDMHRAVIAAKNVVGGVSNVNNPYFAGSGMVLLQSEGTTPTIRFAGSGCYIVHEN